MDPAYILALVVALLHTPHLQHRRCLEASRDRIVEALADGETIGVPAHVMLSVAYHESHVGCDGESDWGAPVDRFHRHTAGTPRHAIRALRRSYEVCGSWEGAVGRFRSGLCRPWNPAHRAYVHSVFVVAQRLQDEATANVGE